MESNQIIINNIKNEPLLPVNENKYIVAVYARISPKGTGRKDKEEASLDIQTSDMLNDLKNKSDWSLYKVYKETVSGSLSFDNRPQGAELMRDAISGKFNIVFIWDNDRLGRDREGMAAQIFRHEMRKLSIQVYSLHQPQILKQPEQFKDDPYDDGQILMEKIQDWQSASTINKFCVRSVRGRADRALSGRLLTIPAYGYRLEPLKDANGEIVIRRDGRVVYKRVIDENEKPYVIRIYYEYIFDGKSMNEIADGLNKDKVPTRRGGLWERATVARILTNPVYCGVLIYNKHFRRKISLSGATRCGLNPSDKWIIIDPDHTEHEAIIKKDLFDRAQEIRRRKLKIGSVAIYNNYLFSGLLICGKCNSKMYSRKITSYYKRKTDGGTTKSVSNGYICGRWQRFRDTDKNYISERDVKESLLSDLKLFRDNPETLNSFLSANNTKHIDDTRNRLAVVDKNLAKVILRSKRLLRLYEDGAISESDYVIEAREINLEAEGVRSEKNRLEEEVTHKEIRDLTKKEFNRAVGNFDSVFASGDIKTQKIFLRSLLDNLIVKRGKLKINYLL